MVRFHKRNSMAHILRSALLAGSLLSLFSSSVDSANGQIRQGTGSPWSANLRKFCDSGIAGACRSWADKDDPNLTQDFPTYEAMRRAGCEAGHLSSCHVYAELMTQDEILTSLERTCLQSQPSACFAFVENAFRHESRHLPREALYRRAALAAKKAASASLSPLSTEGLHPVVIAHLLVDESRLSDAYLTSQLEIRADGVSEGDGNLAVTYLSQHAGRQTATTPTAAALVQALLSNPATMESLKPPRDLRSPYAEFWHALWKTFSASDHAPEELRNALRQQTVRFSQLAPLLFVPQERRPNWNEVLDHLNNAAKGGHAFASLLAGQLWELGVKGKPDEKRALAAYRKAHETYEAMAKSRARESFFNAVERGELQQIMRAHWLQLWERQARPGPAIHSTLNWSNRNFRCAVGFQDAAIVVGPIGSLRGAQVLSGKKPMKKPWNSDNRRSTNHETLRVLLEQARPGLHPPKKLTIVTPRGERRELPLLVGHHLSCSGVRQEYTAVWRTEK